MYIHRIERLNRNFWRVLTPFHSICTFIAIGVLNLMTMNSENLCITTSLMCVYMIVERYKCSACCKLSLDHLDCCDYIVVHEHKIRVILSVALYMFMLVAQEIAW